MNSRIKPRKLSAGDKVATVFLSWGGPSLFLYRYGIGVQLITRMDFGHTAPMFVLPYGVQAEINCEAQTFSIIENAVMD